MNDPNAPYGPAGYMPPPGPPHGAPKKRRTGLIVALSVTGGLVVLGGAIAITAVIALSHHETHAVPPHHTPTPVAAPSSAPATDDASGPVGTQFEVTSGDNGAVYDVTLTKVIDPAQGADEFSTPDNGKRFVGAVFTLKGVSGSESGNSNNDATLIGSNGQTYTPDFNSIRHYTNFNDGDFRTTSGVKLVGAVTFQVPVGVKVTAIEWDPNGGFGTAAPGTWNVG